MIKNFLKEIADKLNIRFPNAEFSKKLEFSKGIVSEYINDKKEVSANFIERLENFYGISYEDFVNEIKKEQSTITKQKGLPLIPIDAMAGFGSGSAQIMDYETSRYIVPEFEELKADFMIRVKGSSMYPKYNSGDLLACKKLPLDTFFQWNKVYVLDTSQGALVKRVKKSDLKGHIYIVSDNKSYDSFDLHLDEVNSLALVVGVIRLE